MLYNIKNLPKRLGFLNESQENKKDIILFFLPENLINNLNVKQFYMTDNHPFSFVDKSTLNYICLEAEKRFGIHFNIDEIYRDILVTIKNENNTAQLLNIRNIENYKSLEKWHEENSNYGKRKTKSNNKIKNKKEQLKNARLKEIEEKKMQERNEFKKEANLLHDFNKSKVVTIDMEFSYFKDQNYYMVTELGITTLLNGVQTSEHFLISEHYMRKYHRENQDKFKFGKTKKLKEKEIIGVIKERLKDANFVVFHEQREDMEILNTLGLDKKYLESNNIQLLDTKKAFSLSFKQKGDKRVSYTIEELLEVFKIKSEYLHNAGNDAKYTTDLLLKMSEIVWFLKKQYLEQKEVSNSKKLKM